MEPKTKAKPRGKPFTKGQSGNTAGRPPKGYSLAEFMRAKLEENDGERLTALFNAVYAKAAEEGNVSAAAEILTRAYGKPIDQVQIETRQKEMPTSLLEAALAYNILPTTSSTSQSEAH